MVTKCYHKNYFNSQPHKEADQTQAGILKRERDFNSQPHKEADAYTVSSPRIRRIFQLTASQGG